MKVGIGWKRGIDDRREMEKYEYLDVRSTYRSYSEAFVLLVPEAVLGEPLSKPPSNYQNILEDHP